MTKQEFDLADALGSYRQLRSYANQPNAQGILMQHPGVPDVIQENSLEVSAISNSKNNSGCQNHNKRSSSHTDGLLTAGNNTQDLRNQNGMIAISIRNGQLVSTANADEEIDYQKFSGHAPSGEIMSDRTKIFGRRGTEPIAAKDDDYSDDLLSKKLAIHCGSNSSSCENLPTATIPNSKILYQAGPDISSKNVNSSVVTTHNNSKQDMLLDHKKIEGTTSRESIAKPVSSDLNYGSSNQVSALPDKSDYPIDSQRPFFVPSGIASEEISRRYPKAQITVSSSRNGIYTGIQTVNSRKELGGQDSSLSNDLTQNGKSEPICSEIQTQRLITAQTEQNHNETQYLEHVRQATSCFPNKNLENTKSHEAIFWTGNGGQNDLSYTYNGSFSVNADGDRVPEQQKLLQSGKIGLYGQAVQQKHLRQVRSNEPVPVIEVRSVSEAPQGMHPHMSTSFSNLKPAIGYTSKKSFSQNRFMAVPSTSQSYFQGEKNSDAIMNQIKLSNQRGRSSEQGDKSSHGHPSPQLRNNASLFHNLASVQNIQVNIPEERGISTTNWTANGSLRVPQNIPGQIHGYEELIDDSQQPIINNLLGHTSDPVNSQQDMFLRNLSQPISSESKNQFIRGMSNKYGTGKVAPHLSGAKMQQDSLHDTYNSSQPQKQAAARNFLIQSSLTFNGQNLSGIANSNQSAGQNGMKESENEIEIWEGDRQTDVRQLQESTLDHQRQSQQVQTKGLILSTVEQKRPLSKQASHHHSRTGSKQYFAQKPNAPSGNENSTSQQLTCSQSQSQQALPHDVLHSSMHQSTQHYLAGDSRYIASMDQPQAAYITSDQALYEVLNSGQQYDSESDNDQQVQSQAHFMARKSVDSIFPRPKSQLSAESDIATALEPKTVFDLPEALLNISQLNQQVADLQTKLNFSQLQENQSKKKLVNLQKERDNQEQEVVKLRERAIDLEQQVMDLVEEKRVLRAQLDKSKLEALEAVENNENIDPNYHNDLIDQLNNLQEENNEMRNHQSNLENQIQMMQEMLEGRDQDDVSQELDNKQKQIDTLRAEKQERDNWLQAQYNHIGMLTSQVERAWNLVKDNYPQKGEIADDIHSQVTEQAEILEDSQQVEELGHRIDMPNDPVNGEIEKLKQIFTQLIRSLPISQSEENRALNHNLNELTQQLRQSFAPQSNQINGLVKQNEDLRAHNEKLKRKLDSVKEQMHNVEHRLKNLRSPNTESQEQILSAQIESQQQLLKVKKETQEMTNHYESQLHHMSSCLGYLFGRIGIPQVQGLKMRQSINELELPKNLYDACEQFDNRLNNLQTKARDCNQVQAEAAYKESQIMAQLEAERRLKRTLMNRVQEIYGNVRVFCRIRPVLKHEYQKRQSLLDYEIIGQNRLVLQGPSKKAFEFDGIFDSGCNQVDVFDELQSVISSAMNGHNVCIMSYGQTGSGKTYTMVGDDTNPGLYFNTVDEIFRLMKLDNAQYQLTASVVEIYNESIRDMLSKDQQNNEVRLVESEGMTFAQQTRRKISSKNSLLRCLRDAFYNRTVGVTQFNEYSSRSHFILSVQIKQTKESGEVRRGQLTLVDLAGSERTLKNDANGVRLQEAQNINKSLSVLSKVFMHLRLKMNHVPYRDSKLTHYLRDCIDGEHSKTVVICQMSPLDKDRGESISSLAFGQKAQQIERIPGTSVTRQSRSKSLESRGRKRMAKSAMSVRSHGTKKMRQSSFSFPKRKSMPPLNRSVMTQANKSAVKSGKKVKKMKSFTRIDTSQKRKARVIRTSKKRKNTEALEISDLSKSPMDYRYFQLREESDCSPIDKSFRRDTRNNGVSARVKEVDPSKVSGRRLIKLEMNNRIFEAPGETDSQSTQNLPTENQQHYRSHGVSTSMHDAKKLIESCAKDSQISTRLDEHLKSKQTGLAIPSHYQSDLQGSIIGKRPGTDLAMVDSTMIFSTQDGPKKSQYSSGLNSYLPETSGIFEKQRQNQEILNLQNSLRRLENSQMSYHTKPPSNKNEEMPQIYNPLRQQQTAIANPLLEELRAVNQRLLDIDRKIANQENRGGNYVNR